MNHFLRFSQSLLAYSILLFLGPILIYSLLISFTGQSFSRHPHASLNTKRILPEKSGVISFAQP